MPAKRTPRVTSDLDIAFFLQDSIRALVSEFGSAGVAVFLVILWEAKRAALSGGRRPTKQGTVTVSLRSIAELSGATGEQVNEVVDSAAAKGLLKRLGGRYKGDRFGVRFLKWDAWEPKDSSSARRKRQYRERKRDTDWGPMS
ncbi:MAG TPA: hypothetical protein VL979_11300 [Solirubrobacteraceae bacterium]|nr:hypothetical protein [Solirubrobacteraceae bacterium]